MNKRSILITGGAGFIGSHVVRHFVNAYPDYHIYNLDKLTYAGNMENVRDLENQSNYTFLKGDIVDAEYIKEIFAKYKFSSVIHLAAESHVDRSITNPLEFIFTNVIGTANLLQTAKSNWKGSDENVFYQVSTDEVYGSLGDTGLFEETTAYDPRSPYSASKASADHFVRAFYHTYHFPIVISNCSNNYGPYQFPEKLIPLVINNIKNEKPLPVYGDGLNVRDWLWVGDHVEAIDTIFHKGKVGETYNIGGNNEMTNIGLVHTLCDLMDDKLGRPKGKSRELITFVTDRKGHDRRYAIDASKIKHDLGWEPKVYPDQGMGMTIDWYLQNESWMENVTSGAYQKYYQEHYQT